jgi:hypothetical protein
VADPELELESPHPPKSSAIDIAAPKSQLTGPAACSFAQPIGTAIVLFPMASIGYSKWRLVHVI